MNASTFPASVEAMDAIGRAAASELFGGAEW
jgi:hypothetical protein